MNNRNPNQRPAGSRPRASRQVSMSSAGDRQASRAPSTPAQRPAEERRTTAPRRPAEASQAASPRRPAAEAPARKPAAPKTGTKPSRPARRPVPDNSRAVAPRKNRHPVSARPSTAVKARSFPRPAVSVEPDNGGGSTLITSLLKAVVYIVAILVVSGLLSFYAISIGNDVFAFVKDSDEIQITLPEGTDVASLGHLLADSGIIQYPRLFDIYVGIRFKTVPEFKAGDYTVSPSMSYDKLVTTFAKSEAPTRTTVIVSIPEGYTVKQIIDTLVNKYGLSSEEELTDAIQNADFDYWFIDELEKEAARRPFRYQNRKYRLEGYLYPDTYYYYSDASAETIINKMLKNFDVKMKNTFKNCKAEGNTYQEKILNLCVGQGRSFDEIVTLASMVQMEAKLDIEFETIASVFHNRLRNPAQTNGKLESDATIQYFLEKRNPDLGSAELNTDDPYNTYLYQGLPPSAITNPTYLAINYALYPEKTNYYYFVATPDGSSLFAKNHKEHQENIAKIEEMMKDS